MALWVVLLSLPLLLLLFKKLASLMLVWGRRHRDDEAELEEWLKRTLSRLRATLRDAEGGQKSELLQLWLQEITDLAYDVEDVIDEFEYEELRGKVEGGGDTQTSGSSGSSFPLSYRSFSNFKVIHSSGRMWFNAVRHVLKVNEIRQRWEKAEKERNDLGLGHVCGREGLHEDTQESLWQTSSLLKEEVLGREEEKEEIVEFLLAPNDGSTPSTIAITGMGGLGKTTLAQLVYNDQRVDAHFKLKMWVYMWADYDVVTFTREVLGSSKNVMPVFGGLKNLDVYQRMLVEELKGKRFLLVIDNLWHLDHRKWQTLREPLLRGGEGSRILITTRDTEVASILQARKIVELDGLPFHDCWKLFQKHAFLNTGPGRYPRLEDIGYQIARKFRGIPLAAITVGGLLQRNADEGEWTRIRDSEIWELGDILSVLKLSYDRLPPQMKQCFEYFSLFPKNYEFHKLELVQQWMAQGFLQTAGTGRMEDVGTRYFDDLLSRSLLRAVRGKFVMHDLIHDLALRISQHGDDRPHNTLKDSQRSCHMSLVMARRQPDQKDLERLSGYRCLRTLAFFFPDYSRFHIPHNLFVIQSLKTLRVLDLSCGGIEELPDSIGGLKHLRYLDVRNNRFKRLPESVCCLYKLQTLKLGDCCWIERLPQGISKLINLRHLEVEPDLLSGVVGIGKLTCLQDLESFEVSEGNGIRIDDLKDMNELSGTLSICNLQRVRSKEEAARAVLSRKRHVCKLEMQWDQFEGQGDRKLQEEVFEALTPPADLKEFAIEGFGGDNFPTWLEQQSLSKLESISLSSCRNWNSLPRFWCLPFLKRIEISGCPQLRNLPSLPTTLEELTMWSVGLDELPEFDQPCYNNICPSLSILRIYGCPTLKSLQRGLLRHHLRNLTVLSIQDCEQLVHWPEGAEFQSTLHSLQNELLLVHCPKLMAFPDGCSLSASLKMLRVVGCPSIPNGPLFAQLHNLSPESSVYVGKCYTSLQYCYEEALKHMRTVDWLMIDEVEDWHQDGQLLSLTCDKGKVWSWRCDDWVFSWRVRICGNMVWRRGDVKNEAALPSSFVPPEDWWERRSPSALARRTDIQGTDADDHHQRHNLVTACFGEHHFPWASSLRWLLVDGNLCGASLPFSVVSLEGLWLSHFKGMRLHLIDALLSNLTGLRELHIHDCPELTLPSLREVIRSLPSLQHLTIEACPGLTSASLSLSLSASTSSSHDAATLQTLFIDDAKLLCNAQFVREHLGSLRGLHIWHADLSVFTAAMEEGLRSLRRSIQQLSFKSCPNLRHLSMGCCPNFTHLPTGRLPSSLEILFIHGCPLLGERCMPPPPPGQEEEEELPQTEWHRIAHVPVIVSNGYIVKGTESEFEELRAKWRGF